MSDWTVVLTGGIGSGKSLVASMFESFGIQIVEQDHISREVVQPGTSALSEITQYFGDEVLQTDGFLNRECLRKKIFADPEKRRWLERLLHPLIGIRTLELLKEATSPYVILVNPLLRARSSSYDCVLVVDVPTEIQVQRIVNRDTISTDLAKSMIAAQIDRDARLALADEVIENKGSIEQLAPSVQALHEKFLKCASLNSTKIARC